MTAPRPKRQEPLQPSARAVMAGDSGRDRLLPVVVALVLGAVLLVQFWPELRQRAADARQSLEALGDKRSAAPPSAASPAPSAVPQRAQPPAVPAAVAAEAAAALDRAAEAIRVLAPAPLQRIDAMSSEAMRIDIAPDGRVVMTSKYAVQRFASGDVNDRRTLFSMALYREQFADAAPQAMASALALPGERYLIGGWHGEVLLWADGGLVRLSGRDERPKGRITDLLRWGDDVLVVGDGLWRWTGEGLREMPLPGPRRVSAVGQRPGELLVAAGRQVQAWRDGQLHAWLQLPDGGGQVERIVPAQAGSDWWVATTRGLYRVSRNGEIRETQLADIWVTSVVERGDELWVGTWHQGVVLRREGRWYRLGTEAGGLADDSVSDLAIDANDRVWLALYGGGGWHAGLEPLREALLMHQWTP